MFDYILKKRIKKMQSEPVRLSDSFRSYTQTRSILILCEYSVYKTLQPHIDNIRKEGKEVLVLAVDTKSQSSALPAENTPDYLKLLRRKAFGRYTQMPSAQVLQSLQQQTFDAMIDATSSPNYAIIYLASAAKSSYKMGLKKGEMNPYHFMIQSETPLEPSTILEKLLFYWKKIDIKDNNL